MRVLVRTDDSLTESIPQSDPPHEVGVVLRSEGESEDNDDDDDDWYDDDDDDDINYDRKRGITWSCPARWVHADDMAVLMMPSAMMTT